MATPSVNEEFSSPVGQLVNYTTLLGGYTSVADKTGVLTASGAPSPQTQFLTQEIKNRHVDIRSFIKADPDHNRQQAELDLFHQLQDAHAQTVSADLVPDAGSFRLTWEEESSFDETVHHDAILQTALISWNATPATIQAAIIAAFPEAQNVLVTSTQLVAPFFPFTVSLRTGSDWYVKLGFADNTLTHTGGAVTLSSTLTTPDKNYLQTADLTPDLTQQQVEAAPGNVQELWGMSGAVGITSFSVGIINSRNKWRGGVVHFSGGAVSAKIQSSTPFAPVNVLTLNSDLTKTDISLVIPDIAAISGSLTLGSCTISFTSDPTGKFADQGGIGADSNAVALNGNIVNTGLEVGFRAHLSVFDNVNIDWTKITGARITLISGGVLAGSIMTFMAMRAIDINTGSVWVPQEIDINTRLLEGESPVSLTGASGNADLMKFAPLIRAKNEYGISNNVPSVTDPEDNKITDSQLSLQFITGNLVADANPKNHVQLFTRQTEAVDGSWTWLTAQLSFSRDTAYLCWFKTHRTSLLVDTISAKTVQAIANLTSNQGYFFSLTTISDTVQITVSLVDQFGDTMLLADSGIITDGTNFVAVAGRMGWWADFETDKDSMLQFFRLASASLATLRTRIFHSHTPVDGAQLLVQASGDAQLWTSFNLGPTISRDSSKSLSGLSYRFVGDGLTTFDGFKTDPIVFDDWKQTFLEFDIWVPQGLAPTMSIYFKAAGVSIGPLTVNTIGGAWCHNRLDLTSLRSQPTGPFSFWIVSAAASAQTVWVDNMLVGRRSVAWEVRAQNGAEWIAFQDEINSPHKALHFNHAQRGTELQLQARALIPSAWISSYTLIPRYAATGRLITAPVPATPTVSLLGKGDSSISVKWPAVAGAYGYKIYKTSVTEGNFQYATEGLTATISGLTPVTGYTIWVLPYNLTGNAAVAGSYFDTTLADHTLPECSIIDPPNNGVPVTDRIALRAWAWDDVDIADVSFLVDGATTNVMQPHDTSTQKQVALHTVQYLYTVGPTTEGTFTLQFGDEETTALQWNEIAANVQAALVALPSIGANVTVTSVEAGAGPLPSHFKILFTGALANTRVPLLVPNSSLNDGDVLISLPYFCIWKSELAAPGTHAVQAIATDTSGNASPASIISVINGVDMTPPHVYIRVPTSGVTLTLTYVAGGGAKGTKIITASPVLTSVARATDDIAVKYVQFYLNGEELGDKITHGPGGLYTLTYQGPQLPAKTANYALSAVAYDYAGNAASPSVRALHVVPSRLRTQ